MSLNLRLSGSNPPPQTQTNTHRALFRHATWLWDYGGPLLAILANVFVRLSDKNSNLNSICTPGVY